MPRHAETRSLPYSAAQMFALVADVERYAEFLPWCQKACIISREADVFIADLTIGYKSLTHTFRSRVIMDCPAEINAEYVGGHMKYLKNQWKFRDLDPAENRSEVNFFVDFSFGSGFLQLAVEAVFSKAVAQMIQAFEARAHEMYGSS